uniref:Uncharacterized protein n=1 Tax=Gadus morhua TaxID=8049 RepID=A0A8C5AWH1_GADMO
MTRPRLEREPLMAVISLKRSPWAWLFSTRSLPARSTRHRVAAGRESSVRGGGGGPRASRGTWEREERSFRVVCAVERFWLAMAMRFCT